jgi:hypothetical protein
VAYPLELIQMRAMSNGPKFDRPKAIRILFSDLPYCVKMKIETSREPTVGSFLLILICLQQFFLDLLATTHPQPPRCSYRTPGAWLRLMGQRWLRMVARWLRAHFKPVARWLRWLLTFEKSDGCGDGCATAPQPWSGCAKGLPQSSFKWSMRSRRHRRSDCTPRAPSDTWRSERGNC